MSTTTKRTALDDRQTWEEFRAEAGRRKREKEQPGEKRGRSRKITPDRSPTSPA